METTDRSQSRLESLKQWARKSSMFKFFCVGVLSLTLLYPVSLVDGLIDEREEARDEVVQEVGAKWGGPQRLSGPILTVPYVKAVTTDGETISRRTGYAYFLPAKLEVDGRLDAKTRSRSIYDVLLYGSKLSFRGHFRRPDFEKLELDDVDIQWNRAYVSLGISDLTGIQDKIRMNFDGETRTFQAGLRNVPVLSSGVSVPVDLSGAASSSAEKFEYDFDVHLNGRKSVQFVPVGEKTQVHLKANSGSPSFGGAYLPDSHSVEKGKFRADWNVLDLNRNFPQQWRNGDYELAKSAFGVELMKPVDHYRKSERSTKYALLFIFLTFTVFLFAEILNDNRIHPIQYLMVGGALSVFYVLLLAISEHAGFNVAYLAASTGVIGLITGYSKSVLRDNALTAIVGGALVALYGFLFTVLQLESYALLAGSIGLFAVLAAVMFLSRNVDWYRVTGRGEKEDEG